MATKCPNCRSLNTQSLLDRDQCVDCGQQFNADGKLSGGIDASTREDYLRRLAPRETNVVGNIADLQRGGAAVLKDEGSVSDGVEPPPGVSPAGLKAEAKANEKVAEALASVDTQLADASAAKAEGVVSATASTSKKDK
jgi:hypothetical protein